MANITGDGTWTIGANWPYPQVLFLQYYTLGIGIDSTNLKLYELYCGTDDVWVAAEIATIGVTANIDSVDVTDFGEFYALSYFNNASGTVTVDGFFRNPGSGAPLTTSLPSSFIPAFGTGCNFNGQGIIGCIAHGNEGNFGDMGYNSVAWSRIGQYDFLVYKSDREQLTDITTGWMNMDWGEYRTGIVHKVKKLGNQVMVYGDGGRQHIFPASEPVPGSWGKGPLAGSGVNSANHIAGDDNIHLFIDTSNEMWLVDKGLKEQKLGYKEWIDDLTNANIKISYSPTKKRFFISDGVTGYGLTQSGLYTTNQCITSCGEYRGVFTGFVKDNADYNWRIQTDTLDFGQRGMKTLMGLEVGGFDDTNVIQTSVKYRYATNGAFAQLANWINCSPEGVSYPVISGTEFRLLARGADYRSAKVELDYLVARLKRTDKRNVRGLFNVSKASTEPDS